MSAGRDVGRFSKESLPPSLAATAAAAARGKVPLRRSDLRGEVESGPPLPRPRAARFACAAAICGLRWRVAAARVNVAVHCEQSVMCSSLTRGLFSAYTPVLRSRIIGFCCRQNAEAAA